MIGRVWGHFPTRKAFYMGRVYSNESKALVVQDRMFVKHDYLRFFIEITFYWQCPKPNLKSPFLAEYCREMLLVSSTILIFTLMYKTCPGSNKAKTSSCMFLFHLLKNLHLLFKDTLPGIERTVQLLFLAAILDLGHPSWLLMLHKCFILIVVIKNELFVV